MSVSINYYNQPWLDVVTYLTRDLGMSLFSKTDSQETYRMQLKEHIVTVAIKIDDKLDGVDLTTILTIDNVNIWWHIHPYHSGYTLDDLKDFDEIYFVRVIIRNSIEFYDAWRYKADL